MSIRTKTFLEFVLLFLVLVHIIFPFTASAFAAEKVLTKVIVRVVAKDSKVIGSGVGGAFVRIRNLETGEILAQGKQEGGTGDTERIMVRPRRRGEIVYGTSGAASFQAEIPLDRPTQAEIYTEAPLAYPHALQKGSKTVTLIPGKHILGEGVVIELDGLIVNILNASPKEVLKMGEEVTIKAEVRMLWGCPFTPGGLWDSDKLEIWGQWIRGEQVLSKFKLTYAGQPTLFQGTTSPPAGFNEAQLQILAADQAGNFGLHTLVYKMLP